MTRWILAFAVAGFVLLSPAYAQEKDDGWLPATAEKLPRWRGFNLLNKFMLANPSPFEEADFRMIHDWGFNFVRIPMDYRLWITGGDWTKIDEKTAFTDLDRAVAWGEKYHVHVCLNFHRAPGYTLAKPPEEKSLWTDPEAQRVCAMHWAAFAKHYKGIPNERLSFNLFNEPQGIDGKTYAAAVAKVAAAIRAEDPDRLIICDGLQWGNDPVPELVPLHVAQATRGYQPGQVTHYHADWVPTSFNLPVPTWPIMKGVSSYLYGPSKKEFQTPLRMNGIFAAGTHLSLKVGTVSDHARLVVKADDAVIFDKTFISGPESKQGEKVVLNKEYNCYQNIFDQAVDVTLPREASQIAISNDDGDWMTLASLSLQPKAGGETYTVPLEAEWGKKQGAALSFQPEDATMPWSGGFEWINREWLYEHQIAPWRRFNTLTEMNEHHGVGIIVGEWGCFNRTPYDVTMRWMEDNLQNFQSMGWGWALWNLHGSFGILDSDRPGAVYVDFEGHKLDKRMLELLQKY